MTKDVMEGTGGEFEVELPGGLEAHIIASKEDPGKGYEPSPTR